MKLLAACMLVAVGLAGCSDDPAPEQTDDFSDDIDLQATDDTGIIRGVVVDNAIVPVEGAVVEVCGKPEFSFTTGVDGAFGFDELDPGFYQVCVEKLGFTSSTVQTNVEAGVDQPPIVKVILEPIPGFSPFYNLFQWEGYIQCNSNYANFCFIANYYPSLVLGDYGGLTDDSSVHFWFDEFIDVGRSPDHLQVETVWEPTQLLGTSFNIRYETAEPGDFLIPCVFGSQEGNSPQIYRINGSQARDAGLGAPDPNPDGEGCDIDDGPDGFAVEFFSGDALGVCQEPGVVNGCYPKLGLTVEQRTSSFITSFYDYVPPQEWIFIETNEVPPPQ